MNRLLSAFILSVALSVPVAQSVPRKPNILLILADDLGYADLSVQGCTQFLTPNVDSIAQKGIRFRQGYVSNSVCAPSRAGILSGRIGIGFEANIPHGTELGLDTALPTMADMLKGAGYKTFGIGKWHLGDRPHHHPNRRGFDEFYGLLGGSRSYFYEKTTPKLIREGKVLERNGVVEDDPQGSYITDRLTQGAVDYIDAHLRQETEQPFFMYLSYTAPHGPLHAKPGYAERYPGIKNEKRRIYAGMMAALDEGVGRVLACLERHVALKNTLIVFLSDNGGPTSDNASDNGFLRGQKGSLWEGGVRVPFFVRWDGVIAAGQVSDHPVISLDLLPTFARIVEVPPVPDASGMDIFPLLLGTFPASYQRELYWRRGGMTQCGLRQGRYKWIENRRTNEQSLFDIEQDPGEKTNLLKSLPEVAKRMAQAYERWESGIPDSAVDGDEK